MERRLLHKQKRASLQTNIATLCRKFKLNEMEEHVLPIFHKATLREVLYLLKKNKKTTSVMSISQALITIVKDEPFAFLEDMFFELYLTHKIVHSARFTWNAFKMLEREGEVALLTATQISEALKNSFRSLAYAPGIKVKLFDAFSWVMIVPGKQKHSGTVFDEKPVICAYSPGEPYFFALQQRIKKEISDGLLSTFGYKRLTECKLSGNDIASMITLLKNRAARAFDAHSTQHTIAPYTPGPGVVTEDGMDLTDEHLKINYANRIFGKDCPLLKRFTVKEMGPIVKKKQMYRTSFTIQSKNIFKCLKTLLVRGFLEIPLSPYIEKLITLGKNTIIIKHINESSLPLELTNGVVSSAE